jgi:hypothetical protein
MRDLFVVLLAPLFVAAIAIRFDRRPGVARVSAAIDAVLAGRWMPVLCGLVSALVMAWVWSGSHFIANIADESAYVLQAQIFSKGAWTMPGRALPEFFEQMHVFVTPFVAAKYFPGQSLLLVPGVAVGFAALVPLLLIFGSGALVFALSRRLTNGWIALLVWAVWTTARANLRFLPTYLSETTTVFLWLLGWWCLYSWHTRPRRRTLMLLAACIGWGLITRPLTGLVFALPAIAVAVWSARRHGLLREIGYAVLVGAVVLAIVPVWSKFTTGRWTETPQALYTRTYIPWDVIGFGLDSTPPLRALPANQSSEIDRFKELHRNHTASSIGSDAVARLGALRTDFFTGWRTGLLVFFALGLLSLTPMLAIGGVTAALLFVAYLFYAHPSFWTVYYLEALPVVALVTVLGFVRATQWLASNIDRGPPSFESARGLADMRVTGGLVSVTLVIVLLLASVPGMRSERDLRTRSAAPRLWLWDIMSRLPTTHNVMFVRDDQRNAPRTMVTNDVDPTHAPTLLAHDLGDEDIKLGLAVADRSAYVIDIGRRTLVALPPVRESVKP